MLLFFVSVFGEAYTYATHTPQEQKEKWENERRKKDNIDKLTDKDGFHDKPNGRAGTPL